ncbi:hypothetical protein D3C87_1029920 [compost metagenome]
MILVRIDADGQLAFFLGHLQGAHAAAASDGEDDIDAALELRAGQFATLGRVIPGAGRGADHVLRDFHLRIDGLRALRVAAGEVADQGNIDAADEADFLALAGHGCRHAHQVGAFFFLEDNGIDVAAGGLAIDQHEFYVRKFLGDLLHGLRLRKADGRDHVEFLAGQATHDLFSLRIARCLHFDEGNARVFFEARCAFESGLVERLVELAARVIHDTQFWGSRGRLSSQKYGCDRQTKLCKFHELAPGRSILYIFYR